MVKEPSCLDHLPSCYQCGQLPQEEYDREWTYFCGCYATGGYKSRDAARMAWRKRNERKRGEKKKRG